MLIHSRNSMSGTWPHDRLGPQEWSDFGPNQDFQPPPGTEKSGAELGEHSRDQSSRPETSAREETATLSGVDPMDVAPLPSPQAQHTSTTSQAEPEHGVMPSINVSSETPLPSCEQAESLERGDDETRSMELEGSMIDEDEEISEEPGDGESSATDRAPTSSYIDKRKMKRFRLTHNQTRFLMSEFARQAHPDAAQRERLSREIPGLSPRQVQVWFQNRRAKLKRLTQDDRERMMRSRALPDDFDMAKALHSPLRAAPYQTLPRPYSTPAASMHFNVLSHLTTIRPPNQPLGHDHGVDSMPSPLSGHSDYTYAGSTGTLSGNQSPSSPSRFSSVNYPRSGFNYRPQYTQGSGSLPNSLYQPPPAPRSVGMPDHLAGGSSSGRSSPTPGGIAYMSSFAQPAPGLSATSVPTSMGQPWSTASYTGLSAPTSHSGLAPHNPLLDTAQPPGRMRSRTSPSSHPGGSFAGTPPSLFTGPFSAPLGGAPMGSPHASQGGSRPALPGPTYAQPYNQTEQQQQQQQQQRQQQAQAGATGPPTQAPSFPNFYSHLGKPGGSGFYEPPGSGPGTPTLRGPLPPAGLGLYRDSEGSERHQGSEGP